MDQNPDRKLIAGLIATAGTRLRPGPRHLVAAGDDRFNEIAVEWLRRWRPQTTVVAMPECSCAAGRCGACN
jgi:hypothetical protein